ncbi:MAG: hypothetical protein EI684_08055 [Candidatus Viridilinea halotolerans]|uniref:Oxaloacetate decarboxylase gamma chain n=1 Tax=Candidatus Viridilinea halotolerans TaxID=2491704 RepID=A0A426U2J9_9CHLR|nr:MAG: hypothetical protein EI684_08055 [Candidatus Viridilinea halotolerans]
MDLTVDPVIIAVQITIIGVIVVFAALALVALALVALGQLNRLPGGKKAQAQEESPVASALPAPAAALPAGQVGPELIAVISAAASAMLGQPVRVTSIRYDSNPGADAWARRGRIAIMDSRRRR